MELFGKDWETQKLIWMIIEEIFGDEEIDEQKIKDMEAYKKLLILQRIDAQHNNPFLTLEVAKWNPRLTRMVSENRVGAYNMITSTSSK